MKIKSFFAATLSIFAFLACSNEVAGPLSDAESQLDAESRAKGYLVLNLVTPPATRTAVGDDTEIASAEESEINSLTVVLTNEAGIIDSVVTINDIEGLSAKFQVALGGHYIYALVNNPIEVKTGENIHRVINIASENDLTLGYKNGSFMMVNKCNNSSENMGVHAFITEKHSVNSPAKVDIFVDRVVCKIYDATDNVETNFSAATLDIVDGVDVLGFVVLNVNKDFNLIQSWSKNNEKGEDVLITPLYNPGEEVVADQYFHNISNYTTLVKSGDVITSIIDNTLDKDIFSFGPVYATENRPTIIEIGGDEITSGRGETTGVIYKVQAKQGNDNSGTFYKYKGMIYANLADIQKFQEFDDVTLEGKPNSELRGLSIKVYEDGVMYYTYYIRDPNTAYQYNGENYYGVFRNSSYRLAVNRISSIGDDVPGGGVVDPDKDGVPGNPLIDRDEAYINVNLTVNPWVLNVLGIDF